MVLLRVPLVLYSEDKMHQTLYRKWRPRTFDEVSGQQRTTEVLKYEIANGKIAHAYLFCGSRGTGKTSCAKIFAKAINCLSNRGGNPCGECEACKAVAAEATTDIIEMDAASNNGVDYIRDIRDSVVYAPAMLKYKVFIIDEVHMLSQQAFNALLKTLEEPPERVVFILATTEVNKLPVTVVSRCQRFDFNRLSIDDITARLKVISEAEGIALDERAARLIGKLARGGMRDAVSLLELCAGGNAPVDTARVSEAAGISPRDSVERTFRAVVECNRAAIFDEIGRIYTSSLDINEFWQQLIEYIRDLMVVKVSRRAGAYLELTDDEIASLSETAKGISFDRLALYSEMLDDALSDLQKGIYDNRVLAEMTLVKMASRNPGSGPEALAARIGELEEKLAVLESALRGFAAEPRTLNAASASYERQEAPDVDETNGEKENAVSGEEDDDLPPFEPDSALSVDPELSSESALPEEAATKATETPAIPDEGLDDWIDVLELIKKEDGAAGGFLSGSFAVRDDAAGKIRVCVSDDFIVMMLDNAETTALITRCLVKVDPNYAGLSVVFEVRRNMKKQKNEIDDILS